VPGLVVYLLNKRRRVSKLNKRRRVAKLKWNEKEDAEASGCNFEFAEIPSTRGG
jgi:hypothetical protein